MRSLIQYQLARPFQCNVSVDRKRGICKQSIGLLTFSRRQKLNPR